MHYTKSNNTFIVRLEKGEQLVAQLTALIEQENITSAWVNGLGGVSSAELGFYDLPNQTYHWTTFDELMELTSLQGNIAVGDDGKPALHLHGSFARSDMSGIGGHIKECEVGGTVELYIEQWQGAPLQRVTDPKIGLKLLDL
jgi:predicted DNA-binding protein with PD1-like motif